MMAHFLRGGRAQAEGQHFPLSQKALQDAWPDREAEEAQKYPFSSFISVYGNRASTALPPSLIGKAAVADGSFPLYVCLFNYSFRRQSMEGEYGVLEVYTHFYFRFSFNHVDPRMES